MIKIDSNSHLKYIVANLPNSIYWKNLSGVYLGANTHALRMVGLNSVEDIIGKTDYDITTKEKADLFRKNDQSVITEDKEICVEEKAYFNKGEIIQLSTKKPIKDEKGNIIGVMGITVDITDIKKTEAMLSKKTKDLEEALSAKKKFLNNLSHEIRTPMHVINSLSEELYNQIDNFSKEEIHSFLLILKQNSNRLTDLVTNLLDMAKNKQGKTYYCFKQRDILVIINEAVNEFKHLFPISLRVSYKSILAYMDELKISQVLRNLIDNAIKYGKNEPITIEVEKIEGENNVLVRVKNKSIGILKKESEKVFEPFFQGSNNKVKTQSTGLGLSICKEIILAHKGRIWIDQDEANITSVNFTMPYIEQQNKKILFVDDDQGVLSMGKMLIKSLGYEILLADSGEKAIEILSSSKSDINFIFVDLRMSGINGLDVLSFMKNTNIHIPVFVQTGESDNDDLKRAKELGAVGHITKPYNKLDVKNAILKMSENVT